MPVESATYIRDLNASYPAGTEYKSQGDDHLRLIKSTVKNTFQNLNCFIVASDTGSSNTFSISASPYSTTYMDCIVLMRSNQTNSGTCRFRINTLSTIPLLDAGGSQIPANGIKNGSLCMIAVSSSTAYLLDTLSFSSISAVFTSLTANSFSGSNISTTNASFSSMTCNSISGTGNFSGTFNANLISGTANLSGSFTGECPTPSLTETNFSLANAKFVWDVVTFTSSSTMQWFFPLYAYTSSKLVNIL